VDNIDVIVSIKGVVSRLEAHRNIPSDRGRKGDVFAGAMDDYPRTFFSLAAGGTDICAG
jgi:hypothetical protein